MAILCFQKRTKRGQTVNSNVGINDFEKPYQESKILNSELEKDPEIQDGEQSLPGDTELKILDNKSETSFSSPTREYSQTKTMLFQSSEKNRNLVNLLIKKKLAKSQRLNRLETECCENLRNFCLDFIDKNFRKPTFNRDYLELITPPPKIQKY